jgi:hypothetical protein
MKAIRELLPGIANFPSVRNLYLRTAKRNYWRDHVMKLRDFYQ